MYDIDELVPISESSHSSASGLAKQNTIPVNSNEKGSTLQKGSIESLEALYNQNLVKQKYYDSDEEGGIFP